MGALLTIAAGLLLAGCFGGEAAVERGGRPRRSRELVDLIVNSVGIDASASRRALELPVRAVETTLTGFEAWARARRLLPRALETA